jgi:ABC-type multidrug transport system fused ATPase/permease subunit
MKSNQEQKKDKSLKNKRLSKESLKKLWRIARFAAPYKSYFIIGMFFLVVSTLTALAFPMLAGKITDAANTSLFGKMKQDIEGDAWAQWFNSVDRVAMAFLVILLIQSVASYFRIWLFAIVTERSIADIRATLYEKMLGLPLSFFEKNRAGDLSSRLSADITQLESLFSFNLAELFRQLMTLLIGVIVIFFTSARLALVMLATFPVMIGMAILFGRFIRKLSRRRQDALAQANVVLEETLQAIQVVKSFVNELFELGRYRRRLDEVVHSGLHSARYRGFFISFIIFALFGGIVLVLWYGARLVEAGELQVGELFSFILYTVFIGGSLGGMSDLYAQLQKSIGASERILEILEEQGEVPALQKELPALQVKGNIQFEDVHFAYPTRPEVEVLRGIRFEIQAGEKIALVGHSGAGKSTIIQLLLKFYTPLKGRILADGLDLQAIDTRAWRSHIAIVPQEVILFGGTIRENIAYGKPGATEEEIIEAARQANAWDFIAQFPDALDTVVGERGVKLSGGQRQRIAIARAILKNPSILILDEATSSLDAESEQAVQQALETLMQGRTTIVIAHRLATVRNMDKILVLKNGRIAEAGTHEELLARPEGIYYNLVRLQLEENYNSSSAKA